MLVPADSPLYRSATAAAARVLPAAMCCVLCLAIGAPAMAQTSTPIATLATLELGEAYDVSDDGTRVALGVRTNTSSRVEVYERSGGTWQRLGQDLAVPGRLGFRAGNDAVAISGDGTRVAVASSTGDRDQGGATANEGAVRVYAYDGAAWQAVGADLFGSESGAGFGTSVALDADGSTLLVGAPSADGAGFDAGYVEVFDFVGGTWASVGGALPGLSSGARFGRSVSMSDDGTRFVAGASERAIAYLRGAAGFTEVQTFLPGDSGTAFGYAVAMSGDGATVAVGEPQGYSAFPGSGGVHVYTLDGTTYAPLGPPLVGAYAYSPSGPGDTYFGSSVALSDDGLRLAVLAEGVDAAEGSAILTYGRVGGTYAPLGDSVTAYFDYTATRFTEHRAVLSGDGGTLVVGDPRAANGAAIVRAYSLEGLIAGLVVAEPPFPSGLSTAVATDGSGRYVAYGRRFNSNTASRDLELHVQDIDNGVPRGDLIPLGTGSVIEGVLLSDDARTAVALVRVSATTSRLHIHRFDGGTWTDASPVSGGAPLPQLLAVDMDAEGRTVVLTAESNGGTEVRVYSFDDATGAFDPNFETLTPPSDVQLFGRAVAIAGDGYSMAVYGVSGTDKTVYRYERNTPSSGFGIRTASTISLGSPNDPRDFAALSLDDDGRTLAASYQFRQGGPPEVAVFRSAGFGSFTRVYSESNTAFLSRVTLSGDGNRLLLQRKISGRQARIVLLEDVGGVWSEVALPAAVESTFPTGDDLSDDGTRVVYYDYARDGAPLGVRQLSYPNPDGNPGVATGFAAGDRLGSTVAIGDDGLTFDAGRPGQGVDLGTGETYRAQLKLRASIEPGPNGSGIDQQVRLLYFDRFDNISNGTPIDFGTDDVVRATLAVASVPYVGAGAPFRSDRVFFGAAVKSVSSANTFDEVRVRSVLADGTDTPYGGDITVALRPTDGSSVAPVVVRASDDGQRVLVDREVVAASSQVVRRTTVFEIVNGTWTQVGQALDSDYRDAATSHVDLSGDGQTVAQYYTEGGAPSRLRLYRLIAGGGSGAPAAATWAVFAEADLGSSPPDDVALSRGGRRVVVGDAAADRNGANGLGADFGRVVAYDVSDGGQVRPLPRPYYGEDRGDAFGTAVDLTPDGLRLIAGAPGFEPDGASLSSDFGRAYVFDLPSAEPFASAPAPVELLSFTAEATAGGTAVDLAWATASERDNVGFAVERSRDGLAWAEIAFVAGAGDADARVDYAWRDGAPGAGTVYYRLRQVDADGGETLSPVRTVTLERETPPELSLYPNPARASVTVAGTAAVAVSFVNALGQSFGRRAIGPGGQVSLAGLPPGMYYVRAGERGAGAIALWVAGE